MKKNTVLAASILGLSLIVAGCGTAAKPETAAAPKTTASKTPINVTKNQVIDPSNQYSGTDNLNKMEALAKANPKSSVVQINAGMSAYSNKEYTKAIEYYNNAIKINPKDGVAYNNIGNVYFRGLNKPQEALAYYEKATQIEPSYNYGWLNLALCQQKLGNIAGAKTTIAQGLKELPGNDPIAVSLKQLQAKIK